MAVVEGFLSKEGDKEEAHGCQQCEKPEAPFPLRDVEDESCEQRSEIWGKDDESGPDVDLAPVIHVREGAYDTRTRLTGVRERRIYL